VSAATQNLTRAEAQERSAHLRVATTEVHLDLTGDTETFGTTTTVTFEATTYATFLDFLGPVVERVVLNGAELDPATCFDGARIHLAPLEAENVVTVVARGAYSRSGEGLHRFVDPVDGQAYLYTQYEPADSRRVLATFEQPDLKSRFTFSVTAPTPWLVLSNQPAVGSEPAGDGLTRTTFAPTPPLSSYLTAVVAGPYHHVRDVWESPDGLRVPLGVLCRASLAPHLDADRVLAVTRQGLDFYHREFAYPYPWGKYDQVFVPEYNLGAMENPGCVTFTERYVFRSAATRNQYQGRANTILHEMAHMWFGDLATPRWWDDLWLKESFADYMGSHASVAATEHTDAWVAFANRRKAWAYTQDQLPTTHPVVADIPDLEAAKQNFDGITYAKGAAVLKQLVAYVGVEAFFDGVRRYFRDHAFAATTLGDLLDALEAASGRNLAEWARLWLQTAGTPELRAEVQVRGGRVERLTVHQRGTDSRTGSPVLRPHRLAVGLYGLADGALVRTARYEVDVDGAVTDVAGAAGAAEPDLVLVNDDDLTYAKVVLDERSAATALAHVGAIPDAMPRSLVWSALWNATRDARLPAAAYLTAVLAHGAHESDTAVLTGLAANARTAVERYVPAPRRPAERERLCEGAWEHLIAAVPGSDDQLVWARAFAAAAATVPAAAGRAREVLAGVVPGLPLDPELRWALWQSLAATGSATRAELDTELARDATADGATRHLAALSALPEPQVRETAFETLLRPGALTNDQVDATLEGYGQPLHPDLTAPLTERYFAALRTVWAEHSIEIADRLVQGLYPGHQDAGDGDPADHPVVARTTRWLEDNADAPGALRRLVLEERDHLVRSLRAQRADR
jgi:aminopeptidase N